MIHPEKTTLDPAGRLVISKRVRQAAGLKPGGEFRIQCRDARSEITPAPIELRFVRHSRAVVAVPERRPREPFAADTVEAILETLREAER